MKRISELGLELIELEDQVLLVESKVGGGKLNDWVKLSVPKIERVEEWNEDLVGFCNKIIASTKLLEGLPLLVIEDDVEDIVGENLKRICSWETYQDHPIGRYAKQALQEHEKAKETFKFTEEDMIEFSIWRSTTIFSEPLTPIGQFEKWKSITKKELWIEVEEWSLAENVEAKNQNVPKITNNQIKAVWK